MTIVASPQKVSIWHRVLSKYSNLCAIIDLLCGNSFLEVGLGYYIRLPLYHFLALLSLGLWGISVKTGGS